MPVFHIFRHLVGTTDLGVVQLYFTLLSQGGSSDSEGRFSNLTLSSRTLNSLRGESEENRLPETTYKLHDLKTPG
jgi:hypothetical protein